MTRNISGGGSKTNQNGLAFEQVTSLQAALESIDKYLVRGHRVYFNGEHIASLVGKNALYTELLKPRGIDYTKLISKKILPDDAIHVIAENMVFIIEKKFQSCSGSVDEKLQTCDFKIKQYRKLLAPMDVEVEYIYVLNDWFLQPKYRDVLEYIHEHGCHYFYNEIPLGFLKLPHLDKEE